VSKRPSRPPRWAHRSLTVAVLFVPACGYHLVHAPSDPLGPFTVVSSAVRVPDAALAAAAEEGARAELSRAGQLAGKEAPGEIEIELLRVDETGEGIALAARDLPLARGLRVTAIGRGRLRRAGAAAAERDTGDLSAEETVARGGSVAAATVGREEAGRAAARRLGEVLVRKLLGFPEPGGP
jgi:hypothetical protein